MSFSLIFQLVILIKIKIRKNTVPGLFYYGQLLLIFDVASNSNVKKVFVYLNMKTSIDIHLQRIAFFTLKISLTNILFVSKSYLYHKGETHI